MKVTEVRVTIPARTENRLLAFASVTFDACFVVHGMKVIDSDKGVFVAMPSKPNKSKAPDAAKFLDIVHPLNHDCRKIIDDAVLDAYELELSKLPSPGNK